MTEDDLYEALEALRDHHEGEEAITEELIRTEKQLNRYKNRNK